VSPQIQDPALSERLRRKFAIVGSSTIDTIAPEIVGVVVVDELLPRLDRFEAMHGLQATGDTGDIAEIVLRNTDPVNNLVIDDFWIGGTAGTTYRYRAGDAGGTEGAGAVLHTSDLRGNLLVPALIHVATDLNSTAGAGQTYWSARILANETWHVKPNTVLAPNGTILGVNVVRDAVHWDVATVAVLLNISVKFHFEPPVIGSG